MQKESIILQKQFKVSGDQTHYYLVNLCKYDSIERNVLTSILILIPEAAGHISGKERKVNESS